MLGEGAFAGSKDCIAGLDARNLRADGFDNSGDICAEKWRFGLAHAGEDANEPRSAAKEVPVIWIDRGGANVEQDLIGGGRGLPDFGVFENVG
jgi:hypothetical protein